MNSLIKPEELSNDSGSDSYELLAPFYDVLELDEHQSTTALNQFLKRLFVKAKVTTISDVACGTGAQSLGLAQDFVVRASDLSESMLDCLRSKQSSERLHSIEHLDMLHADLTHSEACIAMYNAIGHLNLDQTREFIGKCGQELNSPQVLVLDAFSLEYYLENPPGSTWQLDIQKSTPEGELTRHYLAQVVEEGNSFYLETQWKTIHHDKLWEEQSKVRLYSSDEIKSFAELLPKHQLHLRALAEGDMYLFYFTNL